MEELLNSETALVIGGFIAGIATTLIVKGLDALIENIKDSSNKLDDAALPILEDIRDALKGE